jgi:hypothetical protein
LNGEQKRRFPAAFVVSQAGRMCPKTKHFPVIWVADRDGVLQKKISIFRALMDVNHQSES